MIFLGPVYVGERVEIVAEVTYVGRTSIETRIEIFAEPIEARAAEGRRRLRTLCRARRERATAAAGPAAADRDRGRPPRSRAGEARQAHPAGPPRRGARRADRTAA